MSDNIKHLRGEVISQWGNQGEKRQVTLPSAPPKTELERLTALSVLMIVDVDGMQATVNQKKNDLIYYNNPDCPGLKRVHQALDTYAPWLTIHDIALQIQHEYNVAGYTLKLYKLKLASIRDRITLISPFLIKVKETEEELRPQQEEEILNEPEKVIN